MANEIMVNTGSGPAFTATTNASLELSTKTTTLLSAADTDQKDNDTTDSDSAILDEPPYLRYVISKSVLLPMNEPPPKALVDAGVEVDDWRTFWSRTVQSIVLDMERAESKQWRCHVWAFVAVLALIMALDWFIGLRHFGALIACLWALYCSSNARHVTRAAKVSKRDALRLACHDAINIPPIRSFRHLVGLYVIEVDFVWASTACSNRYSSMHLYFVPAVDKCTSNTNSSTSNSSPNDFTAQGGCYLRIPHLYESRFWSPIPLEDLQASLLRPYGGLPLRGRPTFLESTALPSTASSDGIVLPVVPAYSTDDTVSQAAWKQFGSVFIANRQSLLNAYRVTIVVWVVLLASVVIVRPFLILWDVVPATHWAWISALGLAVLAWLTFQCYLVRQNLALRQLLRGYPNNPQTPYLELRRTLEKETRRSNYTWCGGAEDEYHYIYHWVHFLYIFPPSADHDTSAPNEGAPLAAAVVY